MGGADERVRPSKREAEQAVILLRCRHDRAPPLVHGAHVRGNLAPLARAALPPAPAARRIDTRRRSVVSDRTSRLRQRFCSRTTRRDDHRANRGCHTLSASEIVQNCAPARSKRRASAPGLLSGLFAMLDQNQLWQSLAGRLQLAPRRLAVLGWRPVESSETGLAHPMTQLSARDSDCLTMNAALL